MSLTLAEHLSLIEDEHAASLAAPLSARQALLVAVLLDHLPDRVFAARRHAAPNTVFSAEDLPAYRQKLREQSPALSTIFDLCALRPDGPTLKVVAVEVPIADYPNLSTADFMVSLYNGNTVQRVLLVLPDNEAKLAREVIAAAMAWWRESGLAGYPHPVQGGFSS